MRPIMRCLGKEPKTCKKKGQDGPGRDKSGKTEKDKRS